MHNHTLPNRRINRRAILRGAVGAGAFALAGPAFAQPAGATAAEDEPILVVLELSGGNDGLNTVVPVTDDAYYRQRPTLAIPRAQTLPLNDDFGLNPGALGLKRLWDSGDLAVVHGCGYDDPSYSHFTSMGYWHTAAPHSGEAYGWVGRLADELAPAAPPNYLINVGSSQSLAVTSRRHLPVVFDDPQRFQRSVFAHQRATLAAWQPAVTQHPARRFLNEVAASARDASAAVGKAWSSYSSPVDYGITGLDLPKVAACIDAGLPARLYYVAFRNNAFDTHVQQGALHQRLLSYASDALHGFVRDIQRLGHGRRVSVMVFSEFGRRVGENANAGTDHGSANVMLFAGEPVRGGMYGTPPSLTELNAEDNLLHTVDFRRAYATAISGALRAPVAPAVLGGQFEPLPVFVAG